MNSCAVSPAAWVVRFFLYQAADNTNICQMYFKNQNLCMTGISIFSHGNIEIDILWNKIPFGVQLAASSTWTTRFDGRVRCGMSCGCRWVCLCFQIWGKWSSRSAVFTCLRAIQTVAIALSWSVPAVTSSTTPVLDARLENRARAPGEPTA